MATISLHISSSISHARLQITDFNFLQHRDIVFSSIRHAKTSMWTRKDLAHPIDHNTSLQALHWGRMMAKDDPK